MSQSHELWDYDVTRPRVVRFTTWDSGKTVRSCEIYDVDIETKDKSCEIYDADIETKDKSCEIYDADIETKAKSCEIYNIIKQRDRTSGGTELSAIQA